MGLSKNDLETLLANAAAMQVREQLHNTDFSEAEIEEIAAELDIPSAYVERARKYYLPTTAERAQIYESAGADIHTRAKLHREILANSFVHCLTQAFNVPFRWFPGIEEAGYASISRTDDRPGIKIFGRPYFTKKRTMVMSIMVFQSDGWRVNLNYVDEPVLLACAPVFEQHKHNYEFSSNRVYELPLRD